MKLIDAEALKTEILKAPVWTGLDAIAKINTMPSIDITRCKDCVRWNDGICTMFDWYTADNSFCSQGERSRR